MKKYISIIWNRKWGIVAFIVFTAIIFIVAGFIKKPLYKATSVVAVRADKLRVFEKQKSIIKSRKIAHHVFQKLRLSSLKEFNKTKDPLGILLKKIEVVSSEGSGLLRINAYHTDPRLARHLANQFSKFYVSPSVRRLEVKMARVMSFSKVPKEPIKLVTKGILSFSVIFGFIMAVFLEFLRISIKRRKDSDDNKFSSLELPIIGAVPRITGDNNTPYLINNDSQSLIFETYHTIKTNLFSFLNGSNFKPKSIVVTSCFPQEGKTINAINLAIMSAASGERTLLVDTDPKGNIHTIFGKDNNLGFFDFISRELSFNSVVKNTNINNLYLVTSGKRIKLPRTFIFKKINTFLKRAGEDFSKIIFDCSSIKNPLDVRALSESCSGVVLVAEEKRIRSRFLRNSKKLLQDSGANIIGVILNNEEVYL